MFGGFSRFCDLENANALKKRNFLKITETHSRKLVRMGGICEIKGFSLQDRISPGAFVVVANYTQMLLALRIWNMTLETLGPCKKMQPQFLQQCHSHSVQLLLDTQSIIPMADPSPAEFSAAVFSRQFVHLCANKLLE